MIKCEFQSFAAGLEWRAFWLAISSGALLTTARVPICCALWCETSFYTFSSDALLHLKCPPWNFIRERRNLRTLCLTLKNVSYQIRLICRGAAVVLNAYLLKDTLLLLPWYCYNDPTSARHWELFNQPEVKSLINMGREGLVNEKVIITAIG